MRFLSKRMACVVGGMAGVVGGSCVLFHCLLLGREQFFLDLKMQMEEARSTFERDLSLSNAGQCPPPPSRATLP